MYQTCFTLPEKTEAFANLIDAVAFWQIYWGTFTTVMFEATTLFGQVKALSIIITIMCLFLWSAVLFTQNDNII